MYTCINTSRQLGMDKARLGMIRQEEPGSTAKEQEPHRQLPGQSLAATQGCGEGPELARSNHALGRRSWDQNSVLVTRFVTNKISCLSCTEVNMKACGPEANQHGHRRQDSQICFLTQVSERNERSYRDFKLRGWLASLKSVRINYSCYWKPDFPYWRTISLPL